METKTDIERNVDSFLQIGDFVGASFFFSSLALFLIAIFILFQVKGFNKPWKIPLLIVSFVPLVAAFNSFYRRSYWIQTMTDPVEFRFFDWFLTVPLMSITFYFLLRPLGAKKSMFIWLATGAIWMLSFGYLGEAIQPEKAVQWGIVASIGFAVIIGAIMGVGYPKIFRPTTDPVHRNVYLFLSIFLPIGWSVYSFGYMTVPGNMLEGFMDTTSVSIMYNIADVCNKGGLALGTYYLAFKLTEQAELNNELLAATKSRVASKGLNGDLKMNGYENEEKLSKNIHEYE